MRFAGVLQVQGLVEAKAETAFYTEQEICKNVVLHREAYENCGLYV
jgi:hypothetical protein